MKLNTDIFIERCKKIHGDKYDYSKVEYINMKSKVIIICLNHGEFYQSPEHHLSGQNCYKCSFIKRHSDLNNFILQSSKIHSNKYIYDNFIYINSKIKGIIICKKHGEFLQTPNQHLNGRGCKKCYYDSKVEKDIISKFIEVHDNRYTYKDVYYVNSKTKVSITCKKHGNFLQNPHSHLEGKGCPLCSIEDRKKSFDDFLKDSIKLHGCKFEYHNDSFINMSYKMLMKCKIHGQFNITPHSHISRRRGCPKCSNNISNKELDWLDYIGVPGELRHKDIRIDNKIYKVDAYDPDINTIYEFYGDFWHGNPNIYDKNDINVLNKMNFGILFERTISREDYLKSKGYVVISIWESDFKKINNNKLCQ